MRKILIIAFMLMAVMSQAQVLERYVKASETLETGVNFIYKGINIPVADITYHEFSADSATWRKNYEVGDCYVRFNNYSDNSATKHPAARWWGFNFCNIGQGTGGGLDTLFVYYHNNDTITTIDTIVLYNGTMTVNIPSPDTITGSTTNYQDSVEHTHALYVNLNDLEDVEATPLNGQVLKYNTISGLWVAANDLVGGGGSSLTVTTEDEVTNVNNVNEIRVANGKLTDNGIGSVSIDFSLNAVLGAQEFFRTGTQRAGAGDPFIVFGVPFTAADYIVTNAFAIYDDNTRQNLVPDSLTVNGFKVLSILEDSATVHYLAMRALDSLGLAVTEQGRVMGSGADSTLGYLNQSVDDSTITVTNDELHVVNPLTADEVLKLQDSVVVYTELTDTTLVVAFDSVYADTISAINVDATGIVRQGYTWHTYGGFQDSTVTLTLTAQNTWYDITNATNNLYTPTEEAGITVVGDSITFLHTASYSGNLSITFADDVNRDFQIAFGNVVHAGYHIGATTTGASNYANVGLPLFIEATAGDVVYFKIRCTSTAGATPTITSSMFYIQYIHD